MKGFKVALVEVSSPSINIFSRTYLPRVGIPILGSILKRQGFDCDIWFQAMSAVERDQLQKYDLVGIGSLTNTIREAYHLGDSVKSSSTTVVMGGPHVTFMPEEALNHCDYVVIGEGEVTFPSLVMALATGESPEAIPGLAFRMTSGDIHITGHPETVNYTDLPSPDFLLSSQVKPRLIPPIVVTSRGCPHNCYFCTVTSMFGRRYRFKCNEQIIAELSPILNHSVCFGDDNFCANPERTKSLLHDILAHNAVPLRWSGQMCVEDATDEELLRLMQKTRCRIMYIGFESVIPETLMKYGKPHDVRAMELCIEKLHSYDIGIHGMFVVDVDDNVETVRKIVDFALSTDIDTIHICPLIPFPGTLAYEELKGDLLHTEWDYFDGLHVVVEPRKCSAFDMQMAIIKELKRFYSLKRLIIGDTRGRTWRIKYRLGGNHLLRRWVRENKDYILGLQCRFSNLLS